MPYIGVSPFNGVRKKHTYTATASQTSFSGAGTEGITLSYKDSTFVDVYQNGVKLGEADYTSTSGTAIVLGTGASLNDLVEVVVYDVFSVADTVSKADGGTFDVAVSFAGAVTANAGVVVDTITIDAGEIDQSSGDLTLDVAGDLIIDTDGAEVKLKDGGTLYGKLHNNNPGNAATSLIVESSVQDQDILFKGNDGGSVVTALTLDMSAGGALLALSEGKAATTNITQGAAKAWVRTKTASVTVTDSFNMSSVTDSAVGRFAPQINSNMGDGDYCCVLGADDKNDGGSVFIHAIDDAVAMATTGYGTSFKKFTYADADPNDNASSLVMGDLA